MGKVISAHAVVFLEVADDGLDGGPPFEFALDLRREAALLAARVDLELVIGRGVVAAIAGIGDAAIEDVADERLHLRNDRAECVPVIGIAGQCCGMGDELPAGGMVHRGGDAHLDPELVRPVRFALADALDLWRVQGIDLAAALAALLFQHAPGQEQRPYECFLQIFIPDDSPLDVADDTAEIGLELA